MKGLRSFASKKWNGLPIGAMTIALILSLVIGGGVYAAVTLLTGTANVTVQEAITITKASPTDGDWSNNIWAVSTYPGETKTLTLDLANAGSANIPVTVTVTHSDELTEVAFVWNGSGYVPYDTSYTIPGGGDGYVQFQITASTGSTLGTKTLTFAIDR